MEGAASRLEGQFLVFLTTVYQLSKHMYFSDYLLVSFQGTNECFHEFCPTLGCFLGEDWQILFILHQISAQHMPSVLPPAVPSRKSTQKLKAHPPNSTPILTLPLLDKPHLVPSTWWDEHGHLCTAGDLHAPGLRLLVLGHVSHTALRQEQLTLSHTPSFLTLLSPAC